MKKNTYYIIFFIIFFLAILARIFLIEMLPVNDNTQIDSDMGVPITDQDYEKLFDLNTYNKNDHGHLYYTLYLFENHKLCDDTTGQTYHPPVHYIVSAIFLSVLNMFKLSKYQLVEGLQYIGLIYYIFSIFIIFKLFKELDTKPWIKILVFLIYSFFPKFLIMSASISNDYLVFCFILLILIYTIKISKELSIKNVIILAVLLGFGFLTKYNALVMIVPIIYVFMKKMLENRKDFNKFSKTLLMFFIMGIISMSIGISYLLRCLIVLKEYKIAVPYDYLYVGNLSFAEKWGIPVKELILLNNYNSNNVWYNLIFSSLIFNLNYNAYNITIGIFNIILFIISSIFIIKTFINKETSSSFKILFITMSSYFFAYVIYNIRMPYLCTMESRYILIVIFIWIYYGCELFKTIKQQKKEPF